uniref:Uncharacterized protein n=1 Tax=viral metagenome TaxID=1070528 RepID=A0A6C0EHZ2_9ZZZZ
MVGSIIFMRYLKHSNRKIKNNELVNDCIKRNSPSS